MRPQELMIGDWVICSDPTPFRITGIYNKEPYVVTDEDGLEVEIGDLKPIPLTDEILKANGFESHEHEYTLRRRSSYNKYYHIDFFITTDGVFILDIEAANDKGTMMRVHSVIQYVHELQHALRLCGLTELADNFRLIQ